MRKELMKLIAEMQQEKIRITKEKKKYKTECGELAFLCGEQKQIDYFLDWLQNIQIGEPSVKQLGINEE